LRILPRRRADSPRNEAFCTGKRRGRATRYDADMVNVKDLVIMVILAAVWGASFLFLRVAAPVVGPLAVAGCRVTLGAAVLLPLVLLRREGAALRAHVLPLSVAAMLACVLPFLGLSQAARTLPAGLMSILNATTPMWGALIGWLWAGERLAPVRALGLAMGLGGVSLLAADQGQLRAQGAHVAVVLTLASTLMYAIAVHFNKKYLSALSSLGNSAGTLAVAALLLLGPALYLGPQSVHADVLDWQDVPTLVWLALLGLSVLCTALAYLMFYQLIDRIGPSRALNVTFLIPVFGMLWGALLLQERISVLMMLSTGVIVAGTLLSNRADPQFEPSVAQAAQEYP
jgi:drug/metabolite transporter (DMT)-like permease